ncbi:MAG: alpha/beta fold hydrolase [Gammaproteobacteria bacterium]|nr:alpha/beta fold hydrolase [Gammaproteobacteria bacterium]
MRKFSRSIANFVFLIVPAYAGAGEALFQDPADFEAEWPPLMEEVSIPSHGELLTGTFYTAAGEGPHPTIVMLHAFPGYEKNLDLAQSLRRVGYNVLYFDYRGIWGGPAEFSVAGGYEDAASAIKFVVDSKNAGNLRIDRNRIILLGHSYGAVAALDVGATHPDVTCVISLAPEDMTLMVGSEEEQQGLARYTDNLRVVSGYPGQTLIEDLLAHKEEWAMTTTVRSIGDKPYLIIGGALDSNFDATEVSRVVAAGEEAGASAITSNVIENADHSFSAKRVELTVAVATWLERGCH